MSEATPNRPSRRAARNRKVVVESSDEDAIEEQETPPPPTTPRRRKAPRASQLPETTPPKKTPARATRPNKRTAQALSDGAETTPKASGRAARPRKQRRISLENGEENEEVDGAVEGDDTHEPELETSHPSPAELAKRTPGSVDRRRIAKPKSPSAQLQEDSVSSPPANIETSTPRKDIALNGGAETMPGSTTHRDRMKTPEPVSRPSNEVTRTPLPVVITPAQLPKKDPEPRKEPLSQPEIAIKQRSFAIPQQSLEQSGPHQRTVITNLVLVNFKSYAGRQEVGPFHVSFSSVVGPNGSGKSNVIDSLLFVFGFRASKMRQGKLSALIHNSGAYPNLDYCEVEVHFKEIIDLPDGGYEDVPDSKLVISRKAFKNNSSAYYINGKTSSYTIVTTLLREKGIDLDHKRFLILQGEVESIAQMKPKAQGDNDDGLLEYLEDIIGTAKYKQPIEDAAKEAEELNEVCVEKSARVAHVEKEKNSLEDKKNVALKFIREENELARKYSMLYQKNMYECENITNLTADTISQIQLQLDEELEKHRGNEDGIKGLKKKYNQLVKETEALEQDNQIIVRELAKFDKEGVKMQEKQKFLSTKQKKLHKQVQANRLAMSEATEQIERQTHDMEKYGAEVAELEDVIVGEEKELAKIRDELKDKTQVFSDQIAVKQKSLEPYNAKINEKESAKAVTQSELDILNQKKNAGQAALDEIKQKIESIKQTGRAKEEELAEKKEELETLEKQSQELEKRLGDLANKEADIRSAVSNARAKAEEAKASLQQTQNQGSVLTGLMRLKDSGRIEGFHGRLGNLGTIDGKYDVAISTACPQLDNMVVDSVEVGQQCIEYLRKNNLGRAMFICLDRLPNRNLEPIDTPENVPRLFDLVKMSDRKFAPAFYSVLQNTLVAKDMAQANRIAYGAKRWRVVTLDGQLIDKSGTMTGGGTRVAKGGMSSRFAAQTTREKVTELESERDSYEKKFQDFQRKRQEYENALNDVNNQIPRLKTEVSKIELEIQSAFKNMADAKKRRSEIEAENKGSKSDDGATKVLEKKISVIDAEIAEIREEMASIEEEIQHLQDKIMQVGGIRLRSQKSKVDGIREQIETLNQQINAAEVAKSKAQKNFQKAEKQFMSGNKELEGIKEEMDALEEEIKEQTLLYDEARTKAKEAEHYLDTKKEEVAALKEELDEKESELNKTRAIEIEIRNRLEENQKVLAENQKKYAYWQEKLSKLTLHSLRDLGADKLKYEPPKPKGAKRRSRKQVQESDDDEEGGEEESGEEDEIPASAQIVKEEPEEQDEDEQDVIEEPQLEEYSEDELRAMDKDELKAEIALLEEGTQNVNVDLSVLQEYRRRVEEHAARKSDLDEAIAKRESAKARCDELRKRRLDEFMEGFSQISLRLKEMYQMITMGGNAELELVDSLDPFSEGILFSVMPPKKSWKNIANLSGGEKTLSSLALVFALHHYKPTPLYVMDEIDAALDFRNVSIVASYIKERTKNAQFIVISLRNNMFELAARLVGIYKVNHMTKSITIENKDYIIREREKESKPAQRPAIPPSTAVQSTQG